MLPPSVRILVCTEPQDLRRSFGAPGQAWCFQRVEFPPRKEVEPPHREPSLGLVEATK